MMKASLNILAILFSFSACAKTNYVRKEWKYPSDADKDCQNTRAEILMERSQKPVTFRPHKKGKSCTVLTGLWQDFYFPEKITEAKNAHLDHLVPLKVAHDSGGAQWSRKEKKKFANDPDNLVITSSTTNQQKGAKTLETWLPLHRDYACKYYKQWMHVKKKYKLTISEKERSAVRCD